MPLSRLFALVLVALSALSALAASAPALAAQDRPSELRTAFTRAQHLRHGINASEWFAQHAFDYSASFTSRYTDDADIALMARLGFDSVRLSIDPAPLERPPFNKDGLNTDFTARLDHVVDAMLAQKLAVQIDIHPESDYKAKVRASNADVERFTILWRRLAAHYANLDPNLIFFEVMNEPEVSDPYRWAGIQARAAEAIRQAAPHNTLIASGPNYSSIADLLTQHPLPDGNVIYNFHFYEPHEFTHQGAGWGSPWWFQTHGIPYPATESSMPDALKQVADPRDRYDLEHYWLDHWDAHRIKLQIDAAAAWAKDHNVPLLCNEFGVYRSFADPASRSNWIHDVRTALEDDNIGWTMWDYRGGFGVVTKQDGQPAKPDPAVVEALGLKKQ